MADISTLSSQALYFAAAHQASSAASGKLTQSKKTESVKKNAFVNGLKKAQEEATLLSEGFPVEIAGMQLEDAVAFLKDELDFAGENLKNNQSLENLEIYRKKVSQFMKYIVKNNYNFVTAREARKLRSGKIIKPFYQIEVINKRLEQLASEMMYTQRKNLNILAKVEEINGLIIDLMAE